MLPRWHIFWGAIFSLLIWITSPGINIFYIALLFFASFLIDFDHYICSVMKTKKWRLSHSFGYHKEMLKKEKDEHRRGIRKRGDFHFFHTIEFHIVVGLLGFLWVGFFYIFIGMVFHSLLDLFSSLYKDRFYRREYFFVYWLWRRHKNKSMKGSQRKLTTPLASSRNAGIQSKTKGGVKKTDKKRRIDEKRSKKLKTSPVKAKKPLSRRRPAEKRRS